MRERDALKGIKTRKTSQERARRDVFREEMLRRSDFSRRYMSALDFLCIKGT